MSYKPKIAPWPTEFAGKIPVSEMFLSIQGEGRFAGTPALFIRTEILQSRLRLVRYSFHLG